MRAEQSLTISIYTFNSIRCSFLENFQNLSKLKKYMINDITLHIILLSNAAAGDLGIYYDALKQGYNSVVVLNISIENHDGLLDYLKNHFHESDFVLICYQPGKTSITKSYKYFISLLKIWFLDKPRSFLRWPNGGIQILAKHAPLTISSLIVQQPSIYLLGTVSSLSTYLAYRSTGISNNKLLQQTPPSFKLQRDIRGVFCTTNTKKIKSVPLLFQSTTTTQNNTIDTNDIKKDDLLKYSAIFTTTIIFIGIIFYISSTSCIRKRIVL